LATLDSDSDIDQLKAQEAAAEQQYRKQAQALSCNSSKAGESLSQQVSAAMQTMAMAGGQFSVELIPLEQGNAYGLEQVEFQVAAHKGVLLRSLAKVASGGELSRISLAIQVITSKIGTVPALIFDEVDVGIGGKVAEIVGKLLKKLGKGSGKCCVLPICRR
jgi:DNA repair protein RecN (Recombination protein N)